MGRTLGNPTKILGVLGSMSLWLAQCIPSKYMGNRKHKLLLNVSHLKLIKSNNIQFICLIKQNHPSAKVKSSAKTLRPSAQSLADYLGEVLGETWVTIFDAPMDGMNHEPKGIRKPGKTWVLKKLESPYGKTQQQL